jgi:ABC-type transport system involved in multi-copper enzyme maturation permease subunit
VNAVRVIARELRAESRRPTNYWLRVLAAGGVIAVFATFVLGTDVPPAWLGTGLFMVLQRTLLLACWVLVPLMTADCVSRERREGTLGLLFLTPLTPWDVILGKGAVHILRVLTLFLASLPVLGLPFFLGGLNWQMALSAMADQAGAVLLGIAAGLYASTRGGSAIQVMVLAECYSLLLVTIAAMCHAVLGLIFGSIGRTPLGLLFSLGLIMVLDLALFRAVLHLSVRRLAATWQDESAAPEQPAWVKLFSDSEFWRTAFRWDHRRTLDRNPTAWLQEYSWTARLTKWGWLLLLVMAEFVLLVNWESRRLPGWQPAIAAALGAGVAFSAAGSFRRERQAGLLELLLVTPLSPGQLIRGRLWGIGCHYLPAIAVLLVGWFGDLALNPRLYRASPTGLVSLNLLGFVCVSIVGLFLSLGRLNFLLAWLFTWVGAYLLPFVGSIVLLRLGQLTPSAAWAAQSALQVALSAACCFLLWRSLHLRTFVLPGFGSRP